MTKASQLSQVEPSKSTTAFHFSPSGIRAGDVMFCFDQGKWVSPMLRRKGEEDRYLGLPQISEHKGAEAFVKVLAFASGLTLVRLSYIHGEYRFAHKKGANHGK